MAEEEHVEEDKEEEEEEELPRARATKMHNFNIPPTLSPS